MQRRRIQDWAQQVFDLNPQPHVAPVTRNTPGLIDAVAALLLAAVEISRAMGAIKSEDVDEQ